MNADSSSRPSSELRWAALGLLIVGLLIFVKIASFGIWDPWELNAAELAQTLSEGKSIEWRFPRFGTRLLSWSFGMFGVHEWWGRAPIALFGFLTSLMTWFFVRRFAKSESNNSTRLATYAAIIVGTSPLFLFNSRQMMGESAGFFAQILVMFIAMAAVFPSGSEDEQPKRSYMAFGLLILASVFAIDVRGALVGLLPPLLAVSCATMLAGRLSLSKALKDPAVWIGVSSLVLVAIVANEIIADRDYFSPWMGGRPTGGDPPTFEVAAERIFHGFAPWSALALVGLGRLLYESNDVELEEDDPEANTQIRLRVFRLSMVLWAAFGYAAMTLHSARYGTATFLPVVALAIAVAMLLGDVERSDRSWWPSAMVCALLTGLIIRDFALYPSGPIEGLPLADVIVPEVFNPRLLWAATLGFFVVTLVVGFGVNPQGEDRADFKAPYRFIKEQWQQKRRGWILLAGIIVALFTLYGLVCYAGLVSSLSSIAVRVGKILFWIPPGIALVAAFGQLTYAMAVRFSSFRVIPILIAGILVGGYASASFQPALSEHFSPREVYDSFNSLATGEAELAEYRVSGRAAAYYAKGTPKEISSQPELINYLAEPQPRWAVFPADELPALDRAFRKKTKKHLFVADARSARLVLATNNPIAGRKDQNFLAEFVLDEAPATMDKKVGAILENKIELVGYDLDLPHGDYVGAGEKFVVTWYWRSIAPVGGNYKIFLHVDGQGNRLGGDHDPVDDRYPTRLWNEGDIVVDRQELRVPANYRPGQYLFNIGFYSGATRLKVIKGDADDGNRIRAGVMTVR